MRQARASSRSGRVLSAGMPAKGRAASSSLCARAERAWFWVWASVTAFSNVGRDAMARSGNGIPGGGKMMAVKPVLTGTQAHQIQGYLDVAQARGTKESRTRFRRFLRFGKRNACRVFRAIQSPTGTRPDFRRVGPKSGNRDGRCGPDRGERPGRRQTARKVEVCVAMPAHVPSGRGRRKCRLAAAKGSPGFARAEASAAETQSHGLYTNDYRATPRGASSRPSKFADS